jgi:hypothetical protein
MHKLKQTQLEQANERIHRLEQQASTSSSSSSSSNNNTDMPVLVKQINELMSTNRNLEAKNRHLAQDNDFYRATVENNERLKEEKNQIQHHLDTLLPNLKSKIIDLQGQVMRLEREKLQWTRYLQQGDVVGEDAPYQLAKSLAEQRIELTLLKEKSGGDAAKCKLMEDQLIQLNETVKDKRECRIIIMVPY